MSAPRKLTVVFADDDLGMRTLFKTLLSLVDTVEVVGEAKDGDEALALVAQAEPDLVLLDVNMPRLDGLDAAQVIRTTRPETHIILHTAAPNDETRRVAQRLGLPLLDKTRFDDVIEAITGHPNTGGQSLHTDPQVEAAVL